MKGFILELKSCCVLSIVHSVQVKIMQLFLVWMMMFMFHTGSSEDLVKPLKDVMLALEGDTVTLSCNYSGSDNYLFWYQQKSSSSPQFLIKLYSEKKGMSLIHNQTRKEFHLQISSAAVTDSAVYYCAVRPYDNNKLLFGSALKVFVSSQDVSEPSYYVLGDGDPQVCLASDFSKHDANKNDLFKGTEPVLMDNLYSQVAFLSKETENLCEEDGGSDQCEDKLEQDPMVNLMSMTVLGLRLLFLKTLVFNALMTFRLWVSQ